MSFAFFPLDMEDVLQDKIATQLRENGISETKVVPLSAKITQAVCDDVIDASNKASPQTMANLKEVINKHLDPILFNKTNTTDLKDAQKPSDAKQLSELALMRICESISLKKKFICLQLSVSFLLTFLFFYLIHLYL